MEFEFLEKNIINSINKHRPNSTQVDINEYNKNVSKSFIKGEAIALIAANMAIFLVGILIAFVTGLICIKFLLQYLKKHDFKVFMIYRILLALLVILLVTFR